MNRFDFVQGDTHGSAGSSEEEISLVSEGDDGVTLHTNQRNRRAQQRALHR